jgi:hypothetical protein
MNLKSADDLPTKTELWSYTTDRLANTTWIRNKAWTFFDLVAVKIEHSLALQPDDEHYIFSQHGEALPVRTLGPFIDFNIVHSWTNFCQHKHIKTCRDAARTLSFQRTAIPHFKVIDCETRQIIDAPENDEYYVALSYTWGKIANDENTFRPNLPEQLHPTIENALEVTCKMGFKYIWIDRYCIDQNNTTAKLEQIYKMDLIYNRAWITIIAAAGEDPTYGLPGVGQNPRPVYPHVKVGKHLLASTLGNPMKAARDSAWFQRGWTYQEGLLSQRRLIFTDYQVYFECGGMYCCENQNVPLDQLHTPDGQQFEERYCNGSDVGIFPRRLGTAEWEIVDRIQVYSTRRLSNSSDMLNGFLGILRSFEKGSVGLHHCLGVPVFSNRSADVHVTDSDQGRYPTVSGFCIGLCWMAKVPSERRPDFPSWSWTGWIEECLWKTSQYWWSYCHGDPNLQIKFQLLDGQSVSWESFHQRGYAELDSQLSNVLQVSAWVSPIDLKPLMYSSEYTRYFDAVSIRMDALEVFADASLLGVHLVHRWKSDWAPAMVEIMIIQEVEPGIYERVGSGMITQQRIGVDVSKYWKEFRLR